MNTIHFIGIGGIGMSGLAQLALARGVRVSGSDLSSSALIDSLVKQGATVYKGHQASHVPDNAAIVYSTDIKKDNPELLEAKRKGLPLLHRSTYLAALMEGKRSLLVSGTHGKTTTTTLLAHTLMTAGYDPSFALGGISLNYGTNVRQGESNYFVAEADESDGSHLGYSPTAAIVTNIDNDHIAHYGSIEAIEESLLAFLQKVENPFYRIFCMDDPRLRHGQTGGVSYGFHEESDLKILSWSPCEGGARLRLKEKACDTTEELFLPLFGKHNGLNSAAVFLLAKNMGIDTACIKEAFRTFSGVKRRLERKSAHFELFDDYAHHPTEVKATLQGIREAYPKRRLIAFFQPHRPSRMKHVLPFFDSAFLQADVVFLTDLYLSSEREDATCTTDSICSFIQKTHSSLPVQYVPKMEAVAYLYEFLQPDDVLVCMGAGDSTKIANDLGLRFCGSERR